MNKLLALLLASTMVACTAEASEDPPLENTQQSSDELRIRLSIERKCEDPFSIWCPALGLCIKTDQVCRDPNDPIMGSFTFAR